MSFSRCRFYIFLLAWASWTSLSFRLSRIQASSKLDNYQATQSCRLSAVSRSDYRAANSMLPYLRAYHRSSSTLWQRSLRSWTHTKPRLDWGPSVLSWVLSLKRVGWVWYYCLRNQRQPLQRIRAGLTEWNSLNYHWFQGLLHGSKYSSNRSRTLKNSKDYNQTISKSYMRRRGRYSMQ